jgi:diadenosine tetraphosphate (Ap4A) HIT family hydrolase
VPSAPSGVLVLILEPRQHVDFAELDDDLAGQLGRLSVHLARAIESLPHIARAHVYRIGDGAEHLHVWFFARPGDQLQLRGSYLVSWDDLLPPLPEEVRQGDARAVATALAASYGGSAA